MPTRAVLTYSDYAALPDDGRRYELHRGELSPIPTPGKRHQGTLVPLGSRLYEHVRARGLGEVFIAPTDCILSNVTVVQPDILYIATDRLAIISAGQDPRTGCQLILGIIRACQHWDDPAGCEIRIASQDSDRARRCGDLP